MASSSASSSAPLSASSSATPSSSSSAPPSASSSAPPSAAMASSSAPPSAPPSATVTQALYIFTSLTGVESGALYEWLKEVLTLKAELKTAEFYDGRPVEAYRLVFNRWMSEMKGLKKSLKSTELHHKKFDIRCLKDGIIYTECLEFLLKGKSEKLGMTVMTGYIKELQGAIFDMNKQEIGRLYKEILAVPGKAKHQVQHFIDVYEVNKKAMKRQFEAVKSEITPEDLKEMKEEYNNHTRMTEALVKMANEELGKKTVMLSALAPSVETLLQRGSVLTPGLLPVLQRLRHAIENANAQEVKTSVRVLLMATQELKTILPSIFEFFDPKQLKF